MNIGGNVYGRDCYLYNKVTGEVRMLNRLFADTKKK